jgi:hypothetical protein
MIIIAFDEFAEYPDGTVFSFWEEEAGYARDFAVKNDTIRDADGTATEVNMTSLIPERHGKDAPIMTSLQSMYRPHDPDQQFLVYSVEELGEICRALLLGKTALAIHLAPALTPMIVDAIIADTPSEPS